MDIAAMRWKRKMMRLIDADELMQNNTWLWFDKNGNHTIAGDAIEDAPTVDPVKHGHWIFNPKDAIEMMFTLPKCSECGAESSDSGNYCSNCGAKMDKIEECLIMPKADESTIPKGYIRQPQMRLIDANAISYDQLLNTGNKKHPLEWAVSQSRIDNVPTIDAEPVRHGHWIEVQRIHETDHTAICECSLCGDTVWVYDGQRAWNYCQTCGAKMDEVKDETD